MAFGLAFQSAFSKGSGAPPVNLGRIGVFVAREGNSVTLFSFCSSSEKIPPGVQSDVSEPQWNSTSWAEDLQASGLYQSLRSAFFSAESLFRCMESWFASPPMPVRYHHETTLLTEGRTFLCYARLPNMWDSGGHPDHLLFSEHSQNVSPCGTTCDTCRGLLLNPPASWGRQERRYKTTAWVIAGDGAGTQPFLGRLPPCTSPSAGIISCVLDLSYSHASTHLNAFFFEIVCLGVICVVHFRLLMICCLQWSAHWYTVNHEEMQRHPFVTTDSISVELWNGLPVKLWEPSLEKNPILCGSLIFLFMAASHADGCLTSLRWT